MTYYINEHVLFNGRFSFGLGPPHLYLLCVGWEPGPNVQLLGILQGEHFLFFPWVSLLSKDSGWMALYGLMLDLGT